MINEITIKIKGYDDYKTVSSIKLKELVSFVHASNVVAARVDDEIEDLDYSLNKNLNVEFITLENREGLRIYISGLKFLLMVAVKEIFGMDAAVRTKYSFGKGVYCTIDSKNTIKEKELNDIKEYMKKLVDEKIPFEKINASTTSAIRYFNNINEKEKTKYYESYVDESITIYKLANYYNYFYTKMPSDTSVLKYFDLKYVENNSFVLQYPLSNTNEIPNYQNFDKILQEFNKYEEWITKLKVDYVCDVNELVSSSKIEEFILINEMNQNNMINEIVEQIVNDKNIKMVLIGGPSSSGKTTSSKKFALSLKSKGFNPFVISTDDYYKDRVDSPKDKDGNYDFETIDAIEVDLFNEQLKDLISGKEVNMPVFNFKTGKKEFSDKKSKMHSKDIIVIEGLHTMNEEMTKSILKENKYKIYASPFTPLNIDRHNYISTTDVRLLRRIVRDNRTRGYNSLHTLSSWEKVRQGEEKYVFPYQNDMDAVFNTILIYEIGVLKVYVEPLLHSIKKDNKYYEESKRLLNFLSSFFPISSSYVPKESLLREFIGESYFK